MQAVIEKSTFTMYLDYEKLESTAGEEHTCISRGVVVKCPCTPLQPLRCFGKSTALKMCPPNDSQDCNWGFLSFHKKALCWGTDVLTDLEEIGCGLVENKNQIKGLLVLQWDLQGQPSQILCSMRQYKANSYLSPISWSLRPYKQTCYKTDLLYKQIWFITRFFSPVTCKQISLDNAHSLVRSLPMF